MALGWLGGALGSQVLPWAPRLFAHLGTCSCTLCGSSCTLRGRRGTLRHPPSFHVAGVVLGHIDFHFAWQAWHVWLWHWAGSGGALGSYRCRRGRRGFLRGRRGTWRHVAALCVAGVALCVAGVAL